MTSRPLAHSLLLCGLCALSVLGVNSLLVRAHAQNIDKPSVSIDEEVTAFAYAPDGRIIFSVRRMFKTKKFDLQRDDIWLMEPGGKRKRICEGQKFTNGQALFTYQVESFTWSPNGHVIAVSLFTTTMDADSGSREDAPAILLLDDNGREIRANGKDSLVMGAQFPLWLRDQQTLVYLTYGDNPQGLFSLEYFNLSGGPAGKAFEGRTFEGASRVPGSNAAIAVERPPRFEGPARLQRLELLSQEDKEVATLDAYAGGISVSPSGNLVAYFLDKEVLEVRDLGAPTRVARLRVGLGVLQWAPDESRIYLKRTIEKKSADLVSFQIPQLRSYPPHSDVPVAELEPRSMLHGLTVREYSLSPDGHSIAIVLPGKRNLQIFPFQ
jgi:dipeptidyl aminopeptidase/acylaminoacyl peptidase